MAFETRCSGMYRRARRYGVGSSAAAAINRLSLDGGLGGLAINCTVTRWIRMRRRQSRCTKRLSPGGGRRHSMCGTGNWVFSSAVRVCAIVRSRRTHVLCGRCLLFAGRFTGEDRSGDDGGEPRGSGAFAGSCHRSICVASAEGIAGRCLDLEAAAACGLATVCAGRDVR